MTEPEPSSVEKFCHTPCKSSTRLKLEADLSKVYAKALPGPYLRAGQESKKFRAWRTSS